MEENPTIEPTERSIPPVSITKVIPIAKRPEKLPCINKFTIFLYEMNNGDKEADIIIKNTKTRYRE